MLLLACLCHCVIPSITLTAGYISALVTSSCILLSCSSCSELPAAQPHHKPQAGSLCLGASWSHKQASCRHAVLLLCCSAHLPTEYGISVDLLFLILLTMVQMAFSKVLSKVVAPPGLHFLLQPPIRAQRLLLLKAVQQLSIPLQQ